ncbi:MAG: peptidylprolyl isomerase, partial [Acidobacteriota bacterium]
MMPNPVYSPPAAAARRRVVGLCLTLLVAAAPVTADPDAATQDPAAVVATFDAGVVTVDDLLREARAQTKDERMFREAQNMPAARIWRDWAHRVALRRIARGALARGEIADTPMLRVQMRRTARVHALSVWREDAYGLPRAASDDDALRAALAQDPRRLPTRTQLSHIFLRADGAAEVTQAVETLRAWRTEIDGDLAAFRARAREHSDSQTAYRDGKLGFVRPGWLPPAAERVIDALPIGAVSEPIALRGGVHLFYVEGRKPAETVSIDARLPRARAKARADALTQNRTARLDAARQRFPARVADGALRVGDQVLTANALRAVERVDLDDAAGEVAEARRARLIEDEQLYQLARAENQLADSTIARLRDLEDNALLRALLDARGAPLRTAPPEDELRALYDADPTRYRIPRRMAVRVLTVVRPLAGDPLAFLRDLEAAVADLRAAPSDDGFDAWTAAADRYRGDPSTDRDGDATAIRYPLQDQREVAGIVGPLAFEQIKAAPVGTVYPPVQDQRTFVTVGIEAI